MSEGHFRALEPEVFVDAAGNELARGSGVFVRSKILLSGIAAYSGAR